MKSSGRGRSENECEKSNKKMKVNDGHPLIKSFILDEKFKADFQEAFRFVSLSVSLLNFGGRSRLARF